MPAMGQTPQHRIPADVVTAIGDHLDVRRRAKRVADTLGQSGLPEQASHESDHIDAPIVGQAEHRPADSAEAGRLKGKLLSDWRLVKRARFNAAKRLRNRYDAGQFAFAISGIYGFLVPMFLLQFDSYLSNFAAIVISFVAAVAGALSFTMAMHYQHKDFKLRAGQLHECARRINNLSRHLSATHIAAPEDLRPFIHHYDDILATCENHDDVDFALARLTDNPKNLAADEQAAWKYERWLLKWSLFRHTYAVCAVVWLLPLMIGGVIWMTLVPKG